MMRTDFPCAERCKDILPMAMLTSVVAIVFSQVLSFDFVNWDDPWYVINNELIQGWSLSNVFGIATENVARNYAPLTIMSFLFDHTFWGLNATGFHLTNLALHLVNTVLVYALIVQVTGNRFAAFFAAGVFGVHPLQVETVAWVSSRKGLLSATFMLLSLRFWLREARSPQDEMKGIAFLGVALLCKAIAVVVPMIVLLYDVLIRRKQLSEAIAKQLVPGFFCVMLILQTMAAQTTIVGGVRSHIGMSKLQLLGVDLVILWKYVAMIAWPTNLCVLYDQPATGLGWQIAAAVCGWSLVGYVLYRFRTQASQFVFACLCWFVLLIPVLNLFPITTLMNDRYLYLPIIPFAAIIGVGIDRLAQFCMRGQSKLAWQRMAMNGAVACSTLVMLSVSTIDYLPVWKNGRSLWAHARKHAPELTVVQIQWANTLHKEGQTHEAIAVLRQALATTNPDRPDRKRIEEKIDKWTSKTSG